MIVSRASLVALVSCLCACATVKPPAEVHTLYAPGEMNLNPINDRIFTPTNALAVGANDQIAFRQKYFGRMMSGMMHYTSANISSERETVGFFKTPDGDFTCRVDEKTFRH